MATLKQDSNDVGLVRQLLSINGRTGALRLSDIRSITTSNEDSQRRYLKNCFLGNRRDHWGCVYTVVWRKKAYQPNQ